MASACATMTNKHTSTRNVIERAFGVLKLRWRCLLRGLDLSTENGSWVIMACFMLHNVCMDMHDPQPYADDVCCTERVV